MTDNKLLSRKVIVVNDLGIHARPAAMIAKFAQNAEKTVWIDSKENRADASSVIDILSIGGQKGSSLVLEAESENDMDILDAIAKLIENGFGENIDG